MPASLSLLQFICYELPCFAFHRLGGLEVIVKKIPARFQVILLCFKIKLWLNLIKSPLLLFCYCWLVKKQKGTLHCKTTIYLSMSGSPDMMC